MKLRLLVFLCLLSFSGIAQNLQQVGNIDTIKNTLGDPFKLTGNIGVSLRSYNAWDIENRQYPFTSSMTANATIQTYGVTIPVSFIMHNLEEDNNPFQKEYWDGFLTNQGNRLTRFGASPYYKWIKLHLGDRYMNFSEFTLANHHFLGAGVELTPQKWRIAAMAGRLSKAEPQSLSLRTPNIQQFTRTGYGVKVGYGTAVDYIEASMFSAKDDPKSLTQQNDSLFIVTPQENLVLSLRGRKNLSDHLNIQFELAESALTRNAKDPDYDDGFFLYQGLLFQQKTSSLFRAAANAKLEYSENDFRAGLQYRRIDPEYTSLGAYFFNEDLENITAYSNFSMLQKALSLQIQAGYQRNNLDASKEASFKRFIGSASAAYRVKDWNFGANMSNFSSRVDYQLNPELDSLNAVIVSQEINANVSKVFPGNGASFQILNFIAGVQSVNDNIDNPQESAASDLFFANASYSISTRSQWQYSASTDYNSNSLNGINLHRYGLGFQIAKGSKDSKFQTGVGMNYYIQTSSEDYHNNLWNNFLRGSWQAFKDQSFSLQLNWLKNTKTGGGTDTHYSELMGTIGYNMQFGYNPSQKNRADKPTIQ